MDRRAFLTGAAAIGLDVVVFQSAFAQSYPSNIVRMIVPSPAGTPPDIMGRLIANELSESEGWRVIVENKLGAIQTIGLAEALRQPADGYTLASIALPASAAPALIPNMQFPARRRLRAGDQARVGLPRPGRRCLRCPVKSLPEFVALLKSKPDKMTFSSGGFGTPAHLAGEMFKLQTGVRATHVPYQGLPQAIADLMNGTNQYQFITPLPVIELIAAGKLRALAVTGPARLPALKDVPTVGEAGFPDLIIQDWFGILVKTGTPADDRHPAE